MSRSSKTEKRPGGRAPVQVGPAAASAWRSVGRDVWMAVTNKRFLLILLLLESVLLLGRLDNTAVWIDESMNAVLGQNILRFGYPLVWDGEYLEELYYDVEISKDLIRVSHTWLPFYLTALSLAIFGHTDVAARLPFVFCGILSVAAIYFLARRISGDERLAKLSALLLASHAGFLLYSRLARYFSLSFLLIILVVLTYLKWSSEPTKRNLVLFTLCSVLLFHTSYPIWPFVLFTIGVYLLLFDRKKEPGLNRIIPFAGSCAVMAALIVPWVAYADSLNQRRIDPSQSDYLVRLAVFFWKINAWVLPFVGLLVILGLLLLLARMGALKRRPSGPRLRPEYVLLLSIPLYLLIIIVAPHPILSSQYTTPAIPFAMIIAAYLVLRMREYNRWVAAVTLALLLSTNVLQALPYVVVDRLGIDPRRAEAFIVNPRAQFNSPTPLAHYISQELTLRSHLFEYLYFITHPYQHRLKAVVEYLKQHGRPDETVLAPWHDANAIRFYTNMKVVYHFKPTFTIEAVKALVYRPDVTLDWIVPNAYYEPDQPFFKYNRGDYERIYIRCPKDYIYENEPNLDFFIWRTNTRAADGFYIFKRKQGAPAGKAAADQSPAKGEGRSDSPLSSKAATMKTGSVEKSRWSDSRLAARQRSQEASP